MSTTYTRRTRSPGWLDARVVVDGEVAQRMGAGHTWQERRQNHHDGDQSLHERPPRVCSRATGANGIENARIQVQRLFQQIVRTSAVAGAACDPRRLEQQVANRACPGRKRLAGVRIGRAQSPALNSASRARRRRGCSGCGPTRPVRARPRVVAGRDQASKRMAIFQVGIDAVGGEQLRFDVDQLFLLQRIGVTAGGSFDLGQGE